MFLLLKSQDLISDKNDPFGEKNLKRNTEIIFTEKNVVAHCTAVIDPLNKHINNKYMTIDYIAHYRGTRETDRRDCYSKCWRDDPSSEVGYH